MENQEHFFL
jgi:ethanolamine-phosphate cytidylyltransferase